MRLRRNESLCYRGGSGATLRKEEGRSSAKTTGPFPAMAPNGGQSARADLSVDGRKE